MYRVPRTSAIAIAVALGVAGCNQGGSGSGSGPAAQASQPTPAPAFTLGLDSVPAADVVTYGQSLAYDTLPMARDARFLVHQNRSGLAVANYVKLEPELHAWATDTAALAQGRIVARIRSTMADVDPLAGPGTTFVWVDKRYGFWRMGYVRPGGSIFWQVATIATLTSHTMSSVTTQAMSQSRIKQGDDGRWYICSSCSLGGWCQRDTAMSYSAAPAIRAVPVVRR